MWENGKTEERKSGKAGKRKKAEKQKSGKAEKLKIRRRKIGTAKVG
jgi:hypothetical protein